MARGQLRVYLGAAAGVGKTFAMLNEGRRRAEYGEDVVVGFVETHKRRKTAEQIGDLEIVARKRLAYRGTEFEEMDVDAVLARRPSVALVDELAHTNVPGSRNEKRWQDVEELLDAGINVISTLNIQHLESLNDVVEQITGVKQRETIPDEVVRRADELQLVDLTPVALRNRLARGDVYPPERIDTALANYFRPGNLSALRELALAWLADRVDEGLEEYRRRHGIAEPWETRERVLVALTGSSDGERLIRRAARIAQRTKGDLVAVHVVPQDGLSRALGGAARPAARARGRARRDVPRGRRCRRRRRAARRRPLAERDADRHGSNASVALAAAHARVGDRQGHPRVRRRRSTSTSSATPTPARRRRSSSLARAVPPRFPGVARCSALSLRSRACPC